MKPEIVSALRCPRCRRDGVLRLEADESDRREVRRGSLVCEACAERYEIRDGIADLLYDAPDFVRREAVGLERFAEVMRADGWDGDRIRALPDIELAYWIGQAHAMRRLLDAVDLKPGSTIVDIGANTCWATNVFAERGLEAIALDITDVDLQGLGAAEHFLQSGVYFERVMATMFDLPLAGESVDYVFCCQVLHHNDLAHLRRTLREIHRVLRPGGQLFVLDDQLKFPLNLKSDHGREVAEFEGNENVHFFHQYYRAAVRAGLRVRLLRPTGTEGFTGPPWLQFLKASYRLLISGDVSINFIATKK